MAPGPSPLQVWAPCPALMGGGAEGARKKEARPHPVPLGPQGCSSGLTRLWQPVSSLHSSPSSELDPLGLHLSRTPCLTQTKMSLHTPKESLRVQRPSWVWDGGQLEGWDWPKVPLGKQTALSSSLSRQPWPICPSVAQQVLIDQGPEGQGQLEDPPCLSFST